MIPVLDDKRPEGFPSAQNQHVPCICRQIDPPGKGVVFAPPSELSFQIVDIRALVVASEAVEAGLYVSFKGTARHS